MTLILEMSPGPWQTVNDGVMGGISSSRVPDAGPVVPASIKQIGFLLADKTPGPFKLQIRSITFTDGSH